MTQFRADAAGAAAESDHEAGIERPRLVSFVQNLNDDLNRVSHGLGEIVGAPVAMPHEPTRTVNPLHRVHHEDVMTCRVRQHELVAKIPRGIVKADLQYIPDGSIVRGLALQAANPRRERFAEALETVTVDVLFLALGLA